jgi:hypothetical protein
VNKLLSLKRSLLTPINPELWEDVKEMFFKHDERGVKTTIFSYP